MNSHYEGKRVLVVGLGTSGGGVGVARFFAEAHARVTVADAQPRKALISSVALLKKYKNIRYVFGRRDPDIRGFDYIILNPAIDLRSPFAKKVKALARIGVLHIESESGLFLKQCAGKVLAITGTKGKGTTATLLYRMLREEKKDALLGGNIGVSLLEDLPKIKKSTYVVLEISSFQLDLLAVSGIQPRFYISAVTNIYPDHLDRYDSFRDYKKSKLSIFKYPAHFMIDGRKISGRLPKWIDIKKIKLLGEHNKKNIAIAIRAAESSGITRKNIAQAIYAFSGLPHRLEYLGIKNGVAFYNDSYSTTPDSTIAALKSFDFLKEDRLEQRQKTMHSERGRRIILIMGGISKGASFENLAREANKHAKAVILFGKSAKAIKRSFKNVGHRVSNIFETRTVREAVTKAKKNAAKGDIILFSPACASFDQFRNARERGETFKQLYTDIK